MLSLLQITKNIVTKKPKAKAFLFTSYKIEPEKRRAVFCYEIEFANKPSLKFAETIIFPKKVSLKNIPQELLNNVLGSVHIMLGISYYKLYCPSKIKLSQGISKEQAEFWNTAYRKGLGEFFYQNKIDPRELIEFPYEKNIKTASFLLDRKQKMLVGIGGGKDSIVAGELLKENGRDVTALLIETQKSSPISEKIVEVMGVPSLKIQRYLDKQIFALHDGAYNGHIPISAVFAFLGYLTAILYDYSHVVVGNEFSSNFGNVKYKGEEVNHQWSKSMEFETLFQGYVKKFLSPSIVYFSLIRPFYEIRIAEMFSKYKKYFPYFSSCNRSFKVHKERQGDLWCGECAKCVFVFILLSAFLKKKELLEIFGKNLYENKELLPIFEDVLGFGEMKPFDCVGTFDEARVALSLASKNFKNCFIIKKIIPKIKNLESTKDNVFKANNVSTVPEQFRLLGIKKVLILGYGKEGKATHEYLKKYFPKLKISIADKQKNSKYLEMQDGHDIAIKTPGIRKELVTIPYITATNIFFSAIGTTNTIIGVTGSKGKSTTASLIYGILKEAGKKVTLLGNIGKPMISELMRPISKDEMFVIEFSSYQLDDIAYSPNVSVVLNLFPEHMNFHGNVEKYYEAKSNIVKFQQENDTFIYNGKDRILAKWKKSTSAKALSFSNTSLEGIESSLLGNHNTENIKAAIAVAHSFEISRSVIVRAVRKFKPLHHRLENIGNFKGITFYDDANSTAPESTIMAIDALKNIGTIMLGGEDRGYEFGMLETLIKEKRIKNVVLFPDSGTRIFKSRLGLNILETKSMREAVEFAYENTSKGSICLLSTASPSYSLWKNFEEKGDQFQYWVKRLSQ